MMVRSKSLRRHANLASIEPPSTSTPPSTFHLHLQLRCLLCLSATSTPSILEMHSCWYCRRRGSYLFAVFGSDVLYGVTPPPHRALHVVMSRMVMVIVVWITLLHVYDVKPIGVRRRIHVLHAIGDVVGAAYIMRARSCIFTRHCLSLFSMQRGNKLFKFFTLELSAAVLVERVPTHRTIIL
eukprot:SAG31_NODE_3549_length_4134_cov_3.066171_1_plen_182_part_00